MKSCHIILHSPFTPIEEFTKGLVAEYNLELIRFNELLRECIISKAPLSTEIRREMDSGQMVSPELTTKLIETKFESLEKDVLIWGYPRTGEQYKLLVNVLHKHNFRVERIWQFKLIDYNQYIEFKKASDNPYVKKFGVDEASILDKVKNMKKDSLELQQQIEDKSKLTIIEHEHPWEWTPEEFKKIISCA